MTNPYIENLLIYKNPHLTRRLFHQITLKIKVFCKNWPSLTRTPQTRASKTNHESEKGLPDGRPFVTD